MSTAANRLGGAAPEISVVIPVFRCTPCLRPLHARLIAALESIVDDFEVVLVDDRGGDGAWEAIQEIAEQDGRVRGVRLSRNFGQHAAITAGLSEARGAWAVVMDCDLQDPPEEIPRLYAKAREGFDIVYGRRKSKPTTLVRRLTSRLYFKALNVFTGAGIQGEFGSFSMISRKVIDGFLRFRDQDRHYLFILHWLGFDWASVDYAPSTRHAGDSSYSFSALLKHGLSGVFFQTTVLLRWIVYFGFVLAGIGALFAAYLTVARLAGSAFPGWTSIAVIVLLGSGFIITATGITGLYIGKVFDQVKDRPLFIVDETTATADQEPVAAAPMGKKSWDLKRF
jgi:glycosyltransferase involved in cell wall biosynthesis